jgi:hypothetical protein
MKKSAAVGIVVALVLVALSVARPEQAHAGCNLFPTTVKTFNAALGTTNRPFAAPGESVEVTLRNCDPGSLTDPMDTQLPNVTVIFQPPSGPKNAVILTDAADCSAINSQLSTCATQLGGGAATCVAGAQAGLAIVDHEGQPFLSFNFPDTRSTCNGGPNVGKRCTQASDCPGASCAIGTDDQTLAGPAAIAVSAPNATLPCDLATVPCANQSGLRACVDGFYANDGACGTAVPNATFPSFTALPPPNDFQADCFRRSPPPACRDRATRLRPTCASLSTAPATCCCR